MFLKVKGIVELKRDVLSRITENLDTESPFTRYFLGISEITQGSLSKVPSGSFEKKKKDCFKGCIKRSMDHIKLEKKISSIFEERRDSGPEGGSIVSKTLLDNR